MKSANASRTAAYRKNRERIKEMGWKEGDVAYFDIYAVRIVKFRQASVEVVMLVNGENRRLAYEDIFNEPFVWEVK